MRIWLGMMEQHPNVQLASGTTLIFTSAPDCNNETTTNYQLIIDSLLQSGASADLAMNTGATPLFMASAEGHQLVDRHGCQ